MLGYKNNYRCKQSANFKMAYNSIENEKIGVYTKSDKHREG